MELFDLNFEAKLLWQVRGLNEEVPFLQVINALAAITILLEHGQFIHFILIHI